MNSPDDRSALRANHANPGYHLVDFGGGRKLESIAGRLFDRPSPAAEGTTRHTRENWQDAESIFDSAARKWIHRTPVPAEMEVHFRHFQMPVSPTPFGHVGVFPEQIPNWNWLIETAPDGAATERPAALNLFGYTGASSVACALTGMRVAHVDAAKPNVLAARATAALNGLQDHPIRYLVDDAAKFVAREVRRENQYHTIIMDPPAYGHSPKGKVWRLERDLWPLIDDCLECLATEHFRLLITGHSPQIDAGDVLDYLARRLPKSGHVDAGKFNSIAQSGRLHLTDSTGRRLDAGFFVRCRR